MKKYNFSKLEKKIMVSGILGLTRVNYVCVVPIPHLIKKKHDN